MDKIMSKKAVATWLSCDVRTVDRYIAKQIIPHIHIGNRILFSQARLSEWLTPPRRLAVDLDIDPEEKDKLDKARLQEQAEDRLRQRLAETDKGMRLGKRAEAMIQLLQRLNELQGKGNSMSRDEQEEYEEVSDRLREMAAEENIELEKEWAVFKEFFSDIPVDEARRVFDLLTSR